MGGSAVRRRFWIRLLQVERSRTRLSGRFSRDVILRRATRRAAARDDRLTIADLLRSNDSMHIRLFSD